MLKHLVPFPVPCLLLIALGVLPARPAHGDNLIPDAQLKQEAAPNGPLPTWASLGKDSPNATASISDVAPPSGGHTFCIERLTAQGNSRITLRPTIPVQAGHRYYFSCQVRMTGTGAGVLIGSLDSRGKPTKGGFEDIIATNPDVEFSYDGAGLSLRRCLLAQPDAFNTLDMTFTVPEGVAFLSISLNYSWTLGTAWYGDFQLLPLDAAAPSHP
jgi:hypothetical protein